MNRLVGAYSDWSQVWLQFTVWKSCELKSVKYGLQHTINEGNLLMESVYLSILDCTFYFASGCMIFVLFIVTCLCYLQICCEGYRRVRHFWAGGEVLDLGDQPWSSRKSNKKPACVFYSGQGRNRHPPQGKHLILKLKQVIYLSVWQNESSQKIISLR